MAPLLSFGLLLASVFASSDASPVPYTKRQGLPSMNVVQRFPSTSRPSGMPSLVQSDRARAAITFGQNRGSASRLSSTLNPTSLSDNSSSSANITTSAASNGSSVMITNTVVTYLAQVQIGSPATTYELLIDTGSSNTWTGAQAANPYVKTSTSQATGQQVSVTYGSGMFNGTEFLDSVSLGGSLTVPNQSIGTTDAANNVGFQGSDGILGVGPKDLTQGTQTNQNAVVSTITDNLFKQGQIDTEVLGVSFVPSAMNESQNGVLSFGGVDESAFNGDIVYQPITKTEPSSFYWGANISLSMGDTKLTKSMAGIVDTGTTLLLLADDIFEQYASSIPGASLDNVNTGLLQIPISSMSQMLDLNVEWEGTTFALTADGQVFPKALNTALGGTEDVAYGVVSSLGYNSGVGMDFILGMEFLERFYSVYDTSNQRIGLANTAQTNMSFFDLPATSTAGTNSTNDQSTKSTSTSGAAMAAASSSIWMALGAACAGIMAILL